MKNVKLTQTINIEISNYKLSLSDDEAFELYAALAKKFGPLDDDDYMEDEDEFEEDEDEDSDEEASFHNQKFLEDLKKAIDERSKIHHPYPAHPLPVEWPKHPNDFPKFPQIWCTTTTKNTIK